MLLGNKPNSLTAVLHKLHPFTKLAVGVAFAGVSLFLKDPWALGLLVASFSPFLIGFLVQLKPRRLVFLFLFLIFFTVLNFFVSGNLSHAIIYSLRLVIFVGAPLIFSLTTSPQELSRAISLVPIPTGVAVSFMLIWRFFPCMVEEIRRVRFLADMWQLSWSAPKRLYRGTLVPLVFFLFEYTERITLALELRGFSVETPRSCLIKPRFGRLDLLGFIIGLLIVLTAIIMERRLS